MFIFLMIMPLGDFWPRWCWRNCGPSTLCVLTPQPSRSPSAHRSSDDGVDWIKEDGFTVKKYEEFWRKEMADIRAEYDATGKVNNRIFRRYCRKAILGYAERPPAQ